MSTAEATLEGQDPDSLEEPGQEPGEVEEPPTQDEATDLDGAAAADEADAVEQPDDAGAAPVEVTAEAAASEPGPSADASPPFSFRVDGIAVDVEGATERDGVISIPRESWDSHVQNRLVDRPRLTRVQERMQGRIRDLESEMRQREENVRAVLGKVDALLSDKERIQQFAEQYELHAPRFRLEVENELLKARAKMHETTAQTTQQQAELREFEEMARPGLTNAVGYVVDEIAKDTKLDKAKLAEELWELSETGVPIFFEVKEGDGSGLDPKEEKYGVNLVLLRKLLAPRIETARQSSKTQKAAEVEAANKRALGKDKPKPAPTVPAASSPTPGGEAQYPTTREEYEAYKARRSEEVGLPL